MQSGPGNDLVLAGIGYDRVKGSAGADTFWAGAGSDTVTGGSGSNVFLFKSGDGSAVISDYSAGDRLVYIGAPSGLANLVIRQMGADTKVTFADVTVILQGIDHHTVHAADILTGGGAVLSDAATAFFAGWDYIG